MNKTLLLICILALSGCATLTEAEKKDKEWDAGMRRAYTLENAALCMQLMRKAGAISYHINHMHDERRPLRGHRQLAAAREDIIHNRCRMIIPKEMWAD